MRVPDIASPRFKVDPYPFFARLRAEAPVCRARLAVWLSAWLVTRYDDVVAVLRDDRYSKDMTPKMWWIPRSLQALNRNMLNLDPPDHTRLRALVSKAFTPRVVEGMHQRIQAVCDELLDRAAARGGMELVGEYALQVPLTVIADLLGIPQQDRRRFGAWSKRVAAGTSGAVVDLLLGQPALWQSVRYLRGLIALRRAEPRDDLVTALIRAEEAGDRLDEEELVGMIALLLLAGYETTMSLIASGALALIQQPEQGDRLRRDPGLDASAVEELLRYTNPAEFATFRLARQDLVLGPVTIPRGDVVLAVLGSANRDPSQFPDPDTLDLARDPNRHVAFGGGSHYCVGAPLARLEGRIALTTLVRRFPALRLARPEQAPRWRRGLFFRTLDRLPVAL